jgi:hypothetical protein
MKAMSEGVEFEAMNPDGKRKTVQKPWSQIASRFIGKRLF